MAVKFHERAIAIYGVAQIAEGNSAIKTTAQTAGTVTTTVGSSALTGIGTAFLTELTPNAYVFDPTGAIIGQVKTVTTDTAAVLFDNVPASATSQSAGVMAIATAVTGVEFSTGLGPKNALAVLNLNYSTELDTEAFQYTGDELDRDETTVIKDKYAKFDFETFIPALGTIAGGDPTIYEVPMVDWFQSAGLAVILSTGTSGYAKVSNGVASNAYLTVEVRRSSPDLAASFLQKAFVVTDVRGNVDFDGTVGTKGKLKWNYQGNLATVADKTTLVPNFTDQKVTIAPSIKSTTITLSELTLYTDANEPAVAGTSNVCFDKLNAPNVSGFEYQRYQTGCLDGWSKGAVPTDVTITILEDQAGATYNPDDHLEGNHKLTLRYGSTTGYKAEFTFKKLQLAKVANSKVANYAGQDLNFRNIGTTELKLY
jgi:hypothetical protein